MGRLMCDRSRATHVAHNEIVVSGVSPRLGQPPLGNGTPWDAPTWVWTRRPDEESVVRARGAGVT
jgi:hypothetical protein